MGAIITDTGFNYIIQKSFGGSGGVTANTETVFEDFEVGLSSTAEAVSDTSCNSRVPHTYTVSAACDAVDGWANGGDADAELLNTTSGEFNEGTGCLNLAMTHNTGEGYYERTLAAAVNLVTDSKDVYVWFYVDDLSNLSTGTDTVTVWLCSGGSTNNSNEYYFGKTSLTTGWNTLRIPYGTSADNTTGTFDTTDLDFVRFEINIDDDFSTNSLRMDAWTYATDANHEKSPETGYPVHGSSTNTLKWQFKYSTSDANGFILKNCFFKNTSDTGYLSGTYNTFSKSSVKELRFFVINKFTNG